MTLNPKIYKFFCVVDFEATCWESDQTKGEKNNLGNPYEIIEFPSVLFKFNPDNYTLEYVDEFQKYCKPVINPILSEFYTKLTGIKQETVDAAEIFPYVFKKHFDWLLTHVENPNDVILLSCGVWDFESALPQELKRWSRNKELYDKSPNEYDLIVNTPKVYKNFINVKDIYSSFYQIKAYGMVGMLNHLNIKLEGRHHSGLDDSKNIDKILQKIFIDAKSKSDGSESDIVKHLIIRKVTSKLVDQRKQWNHCKKNNNISY